VLSIGLLVVSLSIAALPPARDQARNHLERFEYAEPHMGTRFRIVLYAPDRAIANEAARAAFARVAALDRAMTDYAADSELMRLCRQAGGPPSAVSEELFFVLSRAQEVSRRSGGAFDVTVGPVVRLWRRARRTQRLPDPLELARARELVGHQKVELDQKRHTVRLARPGMRLDLGGIAKGYAADEALEVLRHNGIRSALVAAGGDIAVSASPPGTAGWRIGIAPPDDPERRPSRYLTLHDRAVSTSGDAEQYVEIDGTRYSHIVDPRTGIGLTGRHSVTVVAPHGIMADSLTKVVSVLGPEKGFPLVEVWPGASAMSVTQTERGEQIAMSSRFPQVLLEEHGQGTGR
jgi:thiamine biosynthesis lipoprotein